MMPQTMPISPNTMKEVRQCMYCKQMKTRNGVTAPPQRALIHIIPWARDRSYEGSQRLNALVRFGKQPASPAPNKKRVTINAGKLFTHPVAAVKKDHQSTMRNSTLRGPILSPKYPQGISKRA